MPHLKPPDQASFSILQELTNRLFCPIVFLHLQMFYWKKGIEICNGKEKNK